MNGWQVAAGSVVGRTHRQIGRNNQDAWQVAESDEVMVAVVADGCSSAPCAEVGAQLGASLLAAELLGRASRQQKIDWNQAEYAVLSPIDLLARQLTGDYAANIARYFLFTLVGIVITQERATLFTCGDGFVVINGEQRCLGPFAGNQPPYLGYRLLANAISFDMQQVHLRPIWEGESSTLESFLIGSDGVYDLSQIATHKRPGLSAEVGAIDQFWTRERYFRGNPEIINRELKLIGRDWPSRDPEPGLLDDDTTLVVGRRFSPKEGELCQQ